MKPIILAQTLIAFGLLTTIGLSFYFIADGIQELLETNEDRSETHEFTVKAVQS